MRVSWSIDLFICGVQINEHTSAAPRPNPTNDRSGAEAALEYFPDSLLGVVPDLNATYFESGFYISDRHQQQMLSPLAPTGDSRGSTSSGRRRASALALGNKYAGGAVRGGGRDLERLLRINGDDEGVAAAAAAAAAAVMQGVGGLAPAGLKLSTSDGVRGLLRRLLSRGKLGQSLQTSSSRAAVGAASATKEALAVGEGSLETKTIAATDSSP